VLFWMVSCCLTVFNGNEDRYWSRQACEEPAGKWKLRERHVGKFERSFTFPLMVKREDMKASIEDGVLFITIPKDHEAQNWEEAQRVIASES